MTTAPPVSLQSALGQIRVISVEAGRALIEYEIAPHMCHSGGVAQGGFVCGFIDSAMAHASMTGTSDMVAMTLEVKVSYFAPARPGRVFAEAWVERAGRSTCFTEGKLTNAAGEILAKASSTIRMVPRAAVEASSRRAAE
jgi:acyl-CoA thioesterase